MVLFLLALTMMLTVSSSGVQGTKPSLRGKVFFGNNLEKTSSMVENFGEIDNSTSVSGLEEKQDTGFTTSAVNTTSHSGSHYRYNTTQKSVQTVHSQRFLAQNAFQTCEADQVGVFPKGATEWTPGCQTVVGAAFSGLNELIKLIPTKDDTIKDIVSTLLAPIKLIFDKVAEIAGVGASVCVGNFPGKDIKDPDIGSDMIDICSDIPLPNSKDVEWSLFGTSVEIPEILAAGLCPLTTATTYEFCIAVSKCGEYPSIAFNLGTDIVACAISQSAYATKGLGAAFSSAIDAGLKSVSGGFSLTNSLEVPMTIYNGHGKVDYNARPTYAETIKMAMDSAEIHTKLKDWFSLDFVATRGFSLYGPDQKNMESALTQYLPKKSADDNMLEGLMIDGIQLLNSWDVQAFMKGEVLMNLSFAKIPVIGNILPDLDGVSLFDFQGLISTGIETIIDDSGDTTTIFPGIYLYQGTSAIATALQSFVTPILTNIWSIIDLMPDWLPIEVTADDILKELKLSGDDIDSSDSMGLGITVNTDRAGIFFGMPLGIDVLGSISVNCYTDYESFSCKVSYKDDTAKFFTAAAEIIKDGFLWIVKEADELFQDVGNILAAAYKDPKGTIANIFSEDNLKDTAKNIVNGSLKVLGNIEEDIKAVAAFIVSTILPEAVMDNLTDMVKLVGNVGKKLIDDAESNYKQAEEVFQTARTTIESFGEDAVNWLEQELKAADGNIGRAVASAFDDLADQVTGFIDDVGKFITDGIDSVIDVSEQLWKDACRETSHSDDYINEWDTSHTSCRFKKYEIKSRDQNHVPCCRLQGFPPKCDSRPWTIHVSKKYLVESCVKEHLEKVQIERQAKIARNSALESKLIAIDDNQDAIVAGLYSNSAIICTKTWDRSKKVGSAVPFHVSCTVDTILNTGQKGRRTVTREKLINISNTHMKTSAMAELISNTKDTLIAKITETMNGGFLGCFYDNNNDMSMPTRVGQFYKDPTRCVLECGKQGFDYAATKAGWECRCANESVNYERHGRGVDCECDISGNGGGMYNGKPRQCIYQVKGKVSSHKLSGNEGVSQKPPYDEDGNTDYVLVDYNGDGKSDIAMVRQEPGWGTVPIIFGNGDGYWRETNHGVPNAARWAASTNVKLLTGDFNGDGKTDIAMVNQVQGWGTVPIIFANGDGSWKETNRGVANAARWAGHTDVKLLTGDFNGDGKTDIAMVRQGPGWGTIPIIFANGDGYWRETNRGVGNAARWANTRGMKLLTGDFNGDGKTDIAMVRQETSWGSIPIMFANGDGYWRETNHAVPNAAGWAATKGVRLLTGDFNGDGKTDIAMVRQEPGWGTIPILFSNGDGSWRETNHAVPNAARWAASTNVKLLTGDFNGDGKTDIAMVNQVPGWGTVPIIFSNGDGSWRETNRGVANAAKWAGHTIVKLLTGDFNGDGKTDIAMVRQGPGWGTIPIIFANGDGYWRETNRGVANAPQWAATTGVKLLTRDFN